MITQRFFASIDWIQMLGRHRENMIFGFSQYMFWNMQLLQTRIHILLKLPRKWLEFTRSYGLKIVGILRKLVAVVNRKLILFKSIKNLNRRHSGSRSEQGTESIMRVVKILSGYPVANGVGGTTRKHYRHSMRLCLKTKKIGFEIHAIFGFCLQLFPQIASLKRVKNFDLSGYQLLPGFLLNKSSFIVQMVLISRVAKFLQNMAVFENISWFISQILQVSKLSWRWLQWKLMNHAFCFQQWSLFLRKPLETKPVKDKTLSLVSPRSAEGL